MKNARKVLLLVLCLVLVVSATVMGTLAYLTDKTEEVVNTFTIGNINITLDESEGLDLKMVPGKTITKDPKATVLPNSEKCYLFVKVEKSSNFDDFMTYEMAEGWTALDSANGVYYRVVESGATNQEFQILKGDHVNVKDTVTKAQMDALTEPTYPTLTFTAYAVQFEGVSTPADAWAKL